MAINNKKQNNIQQPNSEERKRDNLELFTENLASSFELKNNFLLEELNDDIIELIAKDQNFKKDLEKALYKNLEKLTHKEFTSGGKHHTPSVRNWLKDFISQQGSGMFDNVALSHYIANSSNVKILNEKEKRLVQKLLLLYRNLKFFPQSLKDVPVEQWEIIPIEKEGEELIKNKRIIGPPKTKEEKKIDELKEIEEKYTEEGLERQAIEEEISDKKKIEDLRIMANNFQKDSLERQAIEEEIKKLER